LSIKEERSGGLLTLTIANSTKANALTESMLNQLTRSVREASEDESLRGVLLVAEGDRGFSAGMDTVQFDHDSSTRAYKTISTLGDVCRAIRESALPVAVGMQGYCIGGALEIAASAEFRVGAKDSWYQMPELRIGIPSVLESVALPSLMGWTKATELMLTTESMSAIEMKECGFLNAVVDRSEIGPALLNYMEKCTRNSRDVVAQQKRLFSTWRNMHHEMAFEDSKKEFSLAFASKGEKE